MKQFTFHSVNTTVISVFLKCSGKYTYVRYDDGIAVKSADIDLMISCKILITLFMISNW